MLNSPSFIARSRRAHVFLTHAAGPLTLAPPGLHTARTLTMYGQRTATVADSTLPDMALAPLPAVHRFVQGTRIVLSISAMHASPNAGATTMRSSLALALAVAVLAATATPGAAAAAGKFNRPKQTAKITPRKRTNPEVSTLVWEEVLDRERRKDNDCDGFGCGTIAYGKKCTSGCDESCTLKTSCDESCDNTCTGTSAL